MDTRNDEHSLGELVAEFSRQTSALMRQEVNLAKTNTTLQQTVDTLKEDMRWAREQTS